MAVNHWVRGSNPRGGAFEAQTVLLFELFFRRLKKGNVSAYFPAYALSVPKVGNTQDDNGVQL